MLSAINVSQVAEPYIRRRAIRHLEKGRVVIFAAGTGNPFFTTDTAAALRALEIGAQAILMGKNGVEGVLDADPREHPDARLIPELTHLEAIERGLKVMDTTALSLCMDNRVPLYVFNLDDESNIERVVRGERIGTMIPRPGPSGGREMIDDVLTDATPADGQERRGGEARVHDRPHGPGLGGAARPRAGERLRHQDAGQPAGDDRRPRAAPAHDHARSTRAS